MYFGKLELWTDADPVPPWYGVQIKKATAECQALTTGMSESLVV